MKKKKFSQGSYNFIDKNVLFQKQAYYCNSHFDSYYKTLCLFKNGRRNGIKIQIINFI